MRSATLAEMPSKMPGARMNSPLVSRSRSARAFRLPVIVFSSPVIASSRERSFARASGCLRATPRDGVALEAGGQVGRRNNGALVGRINPLEQYLLAGEPHGERLVAGTLAGTRPGADALRNLDTHPHGEFGSAARRRAMVGAMPHPVAGQGHAGLGGDRADDVGMAAGRGRGWRRRRIGLRRSLESQP